jgi:hypothetical protein
MSDEAIEYLKNEKPLFENEPVTSDTTLNKQEIAMFLIGRIQDQNYNAIKKKALNGVKHYSEKIAKIIFRLNEYDSDVQCICTKIQYLI